MDDQDGWVIKKGAVPVSNETKKKPWFKEMSKLPPCLKPSKVAEDITPYQTKDKMKQT